MPQVTNEDNAFPEITYQTATLHVLKGYKNVFSTAYGWRKFVNIVDDLTPAGIQKIIIDGNKAAAHYDSYGRQIKPSHKGIHIIKTSEGSSCKILVR